MARSGLKKVVKSVKGKRGSVKRAYWVKADAPLAGYKPNPRFNDAWKKTKKGGLTGWPTKVGRKGFDDAMRIAKRKKKWGIFSSQPPQGSEAAAQRGLGPGGIIKRGGLYHRVDKYIGRASPMKRGLIAAGTVAAMTGLSLGAAFGTAALLKARRRGSMGG